MCFNKNFKIGNVTVGNEAPVRVIAELSCNHQGDLEIAKKTILEMSKVGVDFVKLQTSRPEHITLNSEKSDFVIKAGTIWDNQKLFDLYQETNTPWEWHKELFNYARELGMEIFSSPFDVDAVHFLETLECSAYKIASFEITDVELIETAARTGKPIIISTGIALKEDIERALEVCKSVGNKNVILLKCTSAYPALFSEINISALKNFKADFDILLGVSDHTIGSLVPVMSVAFGGCIIEKHFILDRSMGGADATFSSTPEEFKSFITQVKYAKDSIGVGGYELVERSLKNRNYSRSLYFVKDLVAGDIITAESIRSVRPSFGLHPRFKKEIIGKKVNSNVNYGDPVSFEVIKGS